ncbi:MAG: hypothetical protein ACOY5U_15560 [Pseudomonadota bacterium]
MAEPRLIAVVTALLMLVAASPLRAAYDLNQLREIDRLMSSADWAGLAAYLRSNPGLTLGDDPLARELQAFQARYARSVLDIFAARQPADLQGPSLSVVRPY